MKLSNINNNRHGNRFGVNSFLVPVEAFSDGINTIGLTSSKDSDENEALNLKMNEPKMLKRQDGEQITDI